jgi:acetoacetate decarboxylase
MKFGYSMPNASPLYPAPPFFYKDNVSLNIAFRTTPDALQALVPPPLLPNPGYLAFLYVGEFKVAAPIQVNYLEAGLGVPVLFHGQPGNYYVYLDLAMAGAIVPGREIWGWPKKDARIEFVVENNACRASVWREGVEIIRASVQSLESVDPLPPSQDVPNYNLKIIPSVRRNHPPDVLQLTSSMGSSQKKALFRGQAVLSFASSPSDRLSEIPVLEILNGEQSIDDMSLDYGEVAVDYLAEGQPFATSNFISSRIPNSGPIFDSTGRISSSSATRVSVYPLVKTPKSAGSATGWRGQP